MKFSDVIKITIHYKDRKDFTKINIKKIRLIKHRKWIFLELLMLSKLKEISLVNILIGDEKYDSFERKDLIQFCFQKRKKEKSQRINAFVCIFL